MSEELTTTDHDDELLPGPLPLSPQEEQFCRAFADPESPTYGKPTLSATAAGYVEPHNAAWKLRRRPRIIAKLREWQEQSRVVVEEVLSNLRADRLTALAKEPPDTASAIAADKLMGSHLGMFFENHVITAATAIRTDDETRLEAKKIARLLLAQGQPMLDVQAIPQPAVDDGQGDTNGTDTGK